MERLGWRNVFGFFRSPAKNRLKRIKGSLDLVSGFFCLEVFVGLWGFFLSNTEL